MVKEAVVAKFLADERHKLRSLQLFAQNGMAVRVNSVDLEHALRQISPSLPA